MLLDQRALTACSVQSVVAIIAELIHLNSWARCNNSLGSRSRIVKHLKSLLVVKARTWSCGAVGSTCVSLAVARNAVFGPAVPCVKKRR
jgi:hypothetical protein